MDPTRVAKTVATGQLNGDGLLDDAARIGHGHPSPRQRTAGCGAGDVGCFLCNALIAVAGRFPFQGRFGIDGHKSRSTGRGKELVWVVVDIAFANEQLCVVGSTREQHRHRSLFAVGSIPFAKRSTAIGFLIACVEVVGRCLVMSSETFGRGKHEVVIVDVNTTFAVEHESIGHAIVHDAQ